MIGPERPPAQDEPWNTDKIGGKAPHKIRPILPRMNQTRTNLTKHHRVMKDHVKNAAHTQLFVPGIQRVADVYDLRCVVFPGVLRHHIELDASGIEHWLK